VLTHQYAGLEHLLQFTLSVSVHGGLPHHLTAEDSDDDLGYLTKELRVLKNPETQSGLAGYRDNDVTMRHLWQTLYEIDCGLLGSPLHTRGTDSGLAAKRHSHLCTTAVTGEPCNPEIGVSTKLEGTEGLLYIRFEWAIIVAEPAIVGRQEWFKMIRQYSPEGTEKGLSWPIATGLARRLN
jgi:hypothetical protein